MANSDLVPLPRGDLIHPVSEAKTLLGRGLSSIKKGAYRLTAEERDALYRDARRIYNVLTDDGRVTFVGDIGINPDELIRVHEVFQDLADVGYGKAYWPLSIFYEGGKTIPGDAERARRYNRLAFDWCYEHRMIEDPEIWNDLADQYLRGKRVPNVFHIPEGRRMAPTDSDVSQTMAGDGVSDLEAALFWFRKAAESNYAPALFQISQMYWEGSGVPEDREKALEWQLLAADAGHAQAQWGLAAQHSMRITTASTSDLIEIDEKLALQWALKSAEQGNPRAVASISRLSTEELAQLKARELQLDEIGVKWLAESWWEDEAGIPISIDKVSTTSLDIRYRKARDTFNMTTDDGNKKYDEEPYCFPVQRLDECRVELEELAALKYGKAYFPLHVIYGGEYGVPSDWLRADHYWDLAYAWCFERQLDRDAEIWDDLGTMHRKTDGIKIFTRGEFRMNGDIVVPTRDDEVHYYCGRQTTSQDRALSWYKQAAEEGNSTSMHNLCRLYESGAHLGTGIDRQLGLCWQIASAEAGNANAQYALALKHVFGAKLVNGQSYVIQDEEIGLQWMINASMNGNFYATSFLSDTLSDAEILERQRTSCPVNQIGVHWETNDKDLRHFRQVSPRLSRLGDKWRRR